VRAWVIAGEAHGPAEEKSCAVKQQVTRKPDKVGKSFPAPRHRDRHGAALALRKGGQNWKTSMLTT